METAEPVEKYVEKHEYSILLGVMGVVVANVLCGFGSAYGTAKSAVALAAIAPVKPHLIMKSLLPTIMAGIISIYGLVVSVLIINSMMSAGDKYDDFEGYVHLGAGTAVGVCGLAAGVSIGIVGNCGVRASNLQGSLYVGMLLILIFAEVLGLYGLIAGVIFYAVLGHT